MGDTFHFETVDSFTAGAIGQPGQRTFFLQVAAESETYTFKLEKQQVAALANHLRGLLADLPAVPSATMSQPVLPSVAHWTVGAIGAAFDQAEGNVLIVAEELVATDENGDPIGDEPAGTLTVRLRHDQAAAFIDHAEQLVAAGRPPCEWCGRPVDLDGHACTRMN